MSVVLMYHALYRGNDTSLIDDEDLPYAISEATFIAQMDLLVSRQVGLFDGVETPEIVITFDDGHVSNLDIAVSALVERQLCAYFFITTDFIGKRAGFMDSNQLRILSETPGMVLGSHGKTHTFFDDLTATDSVHELVHSRELVESITGRHCQSISFPGGRYSAQTLMQMKTSGYVQWFDSSVATVSSTEFGLQQEGTDGMAEGCLVPQKAEQPLARVAVRRSTSLEEFSRIIGPDMAYYRQHRRRSQAKRMLRRLLGNRLYHGLYRSISAR